MQKFVIHILRISAASPLFNVFSFPNVWQARAGSSHLHISAHDDIVQAKLSRDGRDMPNRKNQGHLQRSSVQCGFGECWPISSKTFHHRFPNSPCA